MGDNTRHTIYSENMRMLINVKKNMEKGELDKALGILLLIQDNMHEYGNNKEIESICYRYEAYIHFHRGDVEGAMNLILNAMSLDKDMANISGEASCLALLGELYANKGDDNEAHKCFTHAWDIIKELDLSQDMGPFVGSPSKKGKGTSAG